jgi:heme exporter protein D
MMDAPGHIGFIFASYAAAAVVVVGLIAWVMLDFRTQRRNLNDLETRGVTRRSTPPSSATLKQAREDA